MAKFNSERLLCKQQFRSLTGVTADIRDFWEAFGGFLKARFELGENLLDGVKVGAVGREE